MSEHVFRVVTTVFPAFSIRGYRVSHQFYNVQKGSILLHSLFFGTV